MVRLGQLSVQTLHTAWRRCDGDHDYSQVHVHVLARDRLERCCLFEIDDHL
jgi:hypothetical protein